jgi:ribosomal protein S18 acetylase RimI-like enzyme
MQEFEPVGHVGLLSVGRTGMIVELAVSPEHKGRGIAREMVRKMVEQSRSLGHDLTCTVHEDDAETAARFTNMGFEPAVRFRAYRSRTPS